MALPCIEGPPSPFHRRALSEPESGVDDSDVCKCLREIAEHALGVRIDLFCEKPDVIGVPERRAEGLLRLGEAPTPASQELRAPKAAESERPLPDGSTLLVAVQEARSRSQTL